MLNLLDRVFPERLASAAWQEKLTDIVPSYGQRLAENPALLSEVRAFTAQTLQLDEPLNLAIDSDEEQVSDIEQVSEESDGQEGLSEEVESDSSVNETQDDAVTDV